MKRKHLLMLGTNVGSIDMVEYAQRLGHRVTVADYLPDGVGAKAVADAAVEISTRDVAALVEFARSHSVDAVLSGVNEGNIRSAIAVSEELDLPFYCGSEQWDQLMDKGRFRELCIAQDVPRPATYFSGPGAEAVSAEASFRYPLVVKPVDGSSLRGITICDSAEQLSDAVTVATETSMSGDILIEQFVAGEEFTAAYVVVDGQPSLSSLDVRYPFAFPGMTTTFPILRVYPPEFLDDYIEQCDAAARRVCEAVGLTNACVFFQGIRSESGFAIFEAGLRMAAEAPYRFLEAVNGVNPMRHLVETVLEEPSSYSLLKDDPFLGGEVCAIASFVYGEGTIAEIRGLEDAVSRLSEIVDWESRYEAGQNVPADGTLRQVGLRFILRCADRERLRDVLAEINAMVDVLDADGVSLAIKPAPTLIEIDT